jgi:hypothetical protein
VLRIASYYIDCLVFDIVTSDVCNLFMAARVLVFMSVVDAVSASIIGTSPILAGCGVHYGLIYIDALRVCRDSKIPVIQFGQRMAGLHHS